MADKLTLDNYQCRYGVNDIHQFVLDLKQPNSLEKIFPTGDASVQYPKFGQINNQRLTAQEALKIVKALAKDSLKKWLDDSQNRQLKYEVPFSLDVTQPGNYDPLYLRIEQIYKNSIDQLQFEILNPNDPRIAFVSPDGKWVNINFRVPIEVAIAAVIHELIHPTQQPYKPFYMDVGKKGYTERQRLYTPEEEARHYVDGEFEARIFGSLIAMRSGFVNSYIKQNDFNLILDSANFRSCVERQYTWSKCINDLFGFEDLCKDFKSQPSQYESSYQSAQHKKVKLLTVPVPLLRGLFRFY